MKTKHTHEKYFASGMERVRANEEQARKRIKNVLEAGDSALAAITLHDAGQQTEVPEYPNAKLRALQDARAVLAAEAQKATLEALNNPKVDAALAAVEAAEAAVTASAVAIASP